MSNLDIAIKERLSCYNHRWNNEQQEKNAQSIKTICEQFDGLSESDASTIFEIAKDLTFDYCFVKFPD